MPLSISGYILVPIRVGTSNSPFTLTPDNLISNQVAFDAAYPSDESSPRTEYMVQVLDEGTGTGPGGNLSLPDAIFGWTKNEGAFQSGQLEPFQRFDFSGLDQRFKLLTGGPREALGTLESDANTTRLVVSSPPRLFATASFPVRVSVGTTGSGASFTVVPVDAFGSPSAGTVEIDRTSGELNWNASDVTANLGAEVFYQRQAFFQPDESVLGSLGVVGTDTLILSPIPATGQIPSLMFGSRAALTVVERANEAAFTAPAAGTVEWARDTGLVNVHPSDLTTFAGQPLVYEGTFVATFSVPTTSEGLIQNSLSISPIPDEASDVFFRIPNVVQFPETVFVDAIDATGKKNQVQIRRSDGLLGFSAADIATYTGQTVESVVPDVEIERGISLRLFRSVVNPGATDPTISDVTAIYTKGVGDEATLADPIIGQPSVTLPAVPREDLSLILSVTQGTGSFTSSNLPRLDVTSPPTGKGYILDLENRQVLYAERKNTEVLPLPAGDYGAIQLPNFPIFRNALIIELETAPSSGTFSTLTEGVDFVLDTGSGVIEYTQTDGELQVQATASSISGSTLTTTTNLTTAGVQVGDFLLVLSGASEGLYSITALPTDFTATVDPAFPTPDTNVPFEIRRSKEILADRYFREIPPIDPNTRIERLVNLGTVTNLPRLNINAGLASVSRFRFGKTTFSTTVNVVASFTAPGSLSSGTVEIDVTTGDLNFSSADVTGGGDVYWSRTLELGTEYRVQPGLGFIEFTDRMLESEEVFLTYAIANDDGSKTIVEERGVFLVPKELTQPHPTTTSTLSFNPDGREVASSPAPQAFRGGRPQVTGTQVSFSGSTVTFLADNQVTDALPHGSVVSPDENVYIDYYIHEAIGGESNLSVLQPPMATSQISIEAGDLDAPSTSFTLDGDQTANFQTSALLRVNGSEVYLLAGSAYSALDDETTVSLDQTDPQTFKTDFSNPTLEVSSGPIRRSAVGSLPSYFTAEGSYDPIARGSKTVRIPGDLSRVYTTGTILLLTDGFSQDYAFVEGSTYDDAVDRTVITLSGGVLKQYASPTTLLRSVRAILPSPSGTASTSRPPRLDLPFLVYRQVEGSPGVLLTQGVDYTIDDSGQVTFTDGLVENEELGIFYTGVTLVEAGRSTRASWSFVVVPNNSNGLLNQVLKMSYSTYIPDTFFYRVETMTNFRAELAEQFSEEAQAGSPSQGPILENSGGQALYEKGSPSLFFEERDLANQDLVARPTLVAFNDTINALEDALQGLDGRVVGDHDGRFLFDGLIDNPVRPDFASATNQIDDLINIFGSVTQQAYLASNFSRFYPTLKTKFGAAENPVGLETGDPILDLEEDTLRAVSSVRNRSPWAVTTEDAPAGSTTFQVDAAEGAPELLRPGLNVVANLKVAITERDGTVIVPDSPLGSTATVSSTTATTVTLSAPVAAAVPKGSTIRMAATDDVFRQTYTQGIDVGVDLDNGFLTHVSDDDISSFFSPNSNPPAGRALDAVVTIGAANTEPYRFPALDGFTTDDDGNRQFPILSPDPASEQGNLTDELALIDSGSGTLTAAVTESLTGSGTITAADTLDNGGAWPAPAPKVGDLVRITSGSNAGSHFHRITAAGASDVTVEPDFDVASGSVTYEITTDTPLVASAIGTLNSSTVLDDLGENFPASGVLPGHTVVSIAGTFVGQRRQIATVSATQLTFTDGFVGATPGAISYHVVDDLATFGGVGSLQESWETALTRELEGLEGRSDIDFSDIPVEETGSQVTTISSVAMGDYDALVVFVFVAASTVSSATFNGSGLSLGNSITSTASMYVYTTSGVSGVTGDIVVTTASASPFSVKIQALKVSSIRSAVFSAGVTGTTSFSDSITPLGTGDLVLSFAASSSPIYPEYNQNTVVPAMSANSTTALVTAFRGVGGQTESLDYRVLGLAGSLAIAINRDPVVDAIAGQSSQLASLEAFFDEALLDLSTGTATLTSNTLTDGSADFSGDGVAINDVVFVRHGLNQGVYTVASVGTTSLTINETFPNPAAGAVYRVARSSLVAFEALETAIAVLQTTETAIVGTGTLRIQHNSPLLAYRNSSTLDTTAVPSSGRLSVSGSRGRPISDLATRESEVVARASQLTTDVANLESVLTSGRLYDSRFVWIDARINQETGILVKKTRAVENREKALAKIIKDLTKLLTV